jgi:Arc/MetJ-type ribon-helix-helix transcriptional regulator
MTIHLTPEQERRLRAVLRRGAYESVDEVGEGQLSIGIGAAEKSGDRHARSEMEELLNELS